MRESRVEGHILPAMPPACDGASPFEDDTFFKGAVSRAVARVVGRQGHGAEDEASPVDASKQRAFMYALSVGAAPVFSAVGGVRPCAAVRVGSSYFARV